MHDRNNQSGAAAMITVVFVAIILSIMTLSFIRLALNESQISSDDDLTTRAYYAAESGVEEAKRAIAEFQRGDLADLKGDECSLPDTYVGLISLEADYDMEYICQYIDLTPATYQYDFDTAGQTIQVPIKSVDSSGADANFNRMVIKWHVNDSSSNGGDGPVGPGQIRARSPNTDIRFFDTTTWDTNRYPAMMRANLISNLSGSYSRAGINDFVAYLNPVNGSGTVAIPAGNIAGIYQADCNPVAQGEMFCEMEITGFSNARDYSLRLSNLYKSAHVEVSLYDGLTQRFFKDAQAVIDVTGRAGSVFRRVESVVDLSTQSVFPNEAITSLRDICKDFIFTDQAADFQGNTSVAPVDYSSSCTSNNP